MKDTLIWCKTKKQLEDVVSKLSEDGYSVPEADHMWDSYGKEITLRFNGEGKSVAYAPRDWYEGNGYGTPITAKEFLGNKVPNIVIFRRDRNVIAKDVATGTEGIAKCSPTDKFNFHTGASIALARLMSKVPATGVLNPDVRAEWTKLLGITETKAKAYTDADRPEAEFKVGDYVTLKEDVEADKRYGGLELLSGVMYDNAHNQRMTVVRVDWSNDSGTYYYECKYECKCDSKYAFYYSEEMLDKWDESQICEGDIVKVFNTGLNYPTYPRWVGKHISDPYMAARYCFATPNTNEKYKVIKIAKHEFEDVVLAYIEQCDCLGYKNCYLINIKGLVKA